MSVVSSELTKLLKCEIFCHGSSVTVRWVSVNINWVHCVKTFHSPEFNIIHVLSWHEAEEVKWIWRNTGDRVTISFVVGLKKWADRGIADITAFLYGPYFNHITNYLKWSLVQQQGKDSIFLRENVPCLCSQNVWWEIIACFWRWATIYHYDINQNVLF